MRFSTLVTIVALSTSTTLARPSHHAHQHAHRRAEPATSSDVDTVYVYEYQGHSISAQEVNEGIQNGTLVFANGAVMPKESVSAAAVSVIPSAAPAPSSQDIPASTQNIASSAIPTSPLAPVNNAAQNLAIPTPDSPSGPPANPSSSSSSTWSFSPAQGLDSDFPDGQLDCSTFPSEYGAVSLDYLQLGGWSGIQCPTSKTARGFADITTKKDGNCDEGDFCSYACPAGYQKTQWPTMQGSTGQSIGGLLCQGGKLHLTNPSLSKTLCAQGSTEVPITVKNTMNEQTSICRTDYPGTEGETVPLQSNPGTSSNLTCPDAAKYYNWEGKSTSAQYYVNPKGISAEQGCQWGSKENPWGNFAPLNLGVGYSNGAAWLSIFQNLPTTNEKLDFSIEIVGDNGGYDNLVGRCKYENGQYCSGEDYSQTSSDGKGCTVSVSHGSATFVLSS